MYFSMKYPLYSVITVLLPIILWHIVPGALHTTMDGLQNSWLFLRENPIIMLAIGGTSIAQYVQNFIYNIYELATAKFFRTYKFDSSISPTEYKLVYTACNGDGCKFVSPYYVMKNTFASSAKSVIEFYNILNPSTVYIALFNNVPCTIIDSLQSSAGANGLATNTLSITIPSLFASMFENYIRSIMGEKPVCEEGYGSYSAIKYVKSGRSNTTVRRAMNPTNYAFDEGVIERIMSKINTFIQPDTQSKYDREGRPYRLSILLHGPPGTGKTTIAKLIASFIKKDITVVTSSDNILSIFASCTTLYSIIVLEDVDSLFPARRSSGGEDANSALGNSPAPTCTFSDILNEMDGITAHEGRIVIMTTNHRDRLDQALLRKGRVDLDEYIGNATRYQIRACVTRKFPDISEVDMLKFLDTVPENAISMAHMQEYMLDNTTIESLMMNVHTLVPVCANL
jgi:ATP-dependent Zn protease